MFVYFFTQKLIYLIYFYAKKLSVLNSSFTVFFLLKIEKILFKAWKSDFLIRKCGHEFSGWLLLFFLFLSLCLSDQMFHIWFFTYFSYWKIRIFVILFFVSLDIFIVTINFTMFICGAIKSHPCISNIHRHKINWTQRTKIIQLWSST